MQLNDKSALITGAGSGIGAAIARAFAREGAKVCVADIDFEAAQRVVDELGLPPSSAVAVRIDVTSEGEVERGVDAASQALGGIDILVSNAGVQHLDAIADVTFDNWRRIISIHLDGGFLMTRACLRHMRAQQRGGTVLLMGSVHAKEASLQKGPYVAAKHGLLGLCRVVAKEGADYGVRANLICPGYVRTPLVESQIPVLARERGITEEAVVREVMLGTTVDGEFTTVEDIARVAVFLAAFPTNALTGQSVVVSHGWHMA
ncbi:3-hydroxybutyrate dehydrogenase [Trinickia mobilis]|uniref:3-hydroxybutyrate dehydrogenase n=1 Tax=Trinickia mobilis TaxID=2816356 RepID=UPI001A900C7A|nr:3-hydroxybutyrate dehydrogenase [Trinickia mobilis]